MNGGKRQERVREQWLDDIRVVLSTEAGRRFYWDVMAFAGIFEDGMTGNSTTFFNCGKRNVGLRMFHGMVDAAPEVFVVMQQEQKQNLDQINREEVFDDE